MAIFPLTLSLVTRSGGRSSVGPCSQGGSEAGGRGGKPRSQGNFIASLGKWGGERGGDIKHIERHREIKSSVMFISRIIKR